MALVDRYVPLDLNSCMGYGMSHGCDAECPVLWNGTCDAIEDVLEQIPLDDCQEEELREMYYLDKPICKSVW